MDMAKALGDISCYFALMREELIFASAESVCGRQWAYANPNILNSVLQESIKKWVFFLVGDFFLHNLWSAEHNFYLLEERCEERSCLRDGWDVNDETLERMLWILQRHLEIFHYFALTREELIFASAESVCGRKWAYANHNILTSVQREESIFRMLSRCWLGERRSANELCELCAVHSRLCEMLTARSRTLSAAPHARSLAVSVRAAQSVLK